MPVLMTEVLTEVEAAPARAAAARKVLTRRDDHWSGADLARAVHRAVTFHPAARKLADTEREAVGQEVALRLWARKGLERVASEYVARTVSTVLESKGWQDTAARYLTATERQRDTGPMIVPAGLAGDVAGNLAASVAGESVDVLPADVPDLARLVADHLAVDPVERRRVTARLVQAMSVAGATDPALALADLALAQGRTLNAVRIDAARGADAIAEVEPADLLALIRDVARESGLARTAVADRIELSHTERAAAEAVAALAREGGSWDAASIGTGRSLPEWPERRIQPDAAPFPSLRRPIVHPAA